MEQIQGYVERITYQSPENGYTVAQLQQSKKSGLTCITGVMPALQPGETIRCCGAWQRHAVHGIQFQVKEVQVEAPADVKGIEKYLGSGLVKGIGPTYAKRITATFGLDTLSIIDETPERLLEIPGVGKKRIEKIKACWMDQKSIRDVMVFLQSNGISPAYAQKIFKIYGNKSIEKVRENPYHLARDIFGIGFKMADRIAQEMNIAKDSPLRIDSGIEYVLYELAGEGHACYPLANFIQEAEKILEAGSAIIEERVLAIQEEKRIFIAEQFYEGTLKKFIWSTPLFRSEDGIAKEIRRLLQTKSHLRQVDAEKALEWVQNKLNLKLGENQKTAVGFALSEKVQVITGGPGTGKSTITKAILEITEILTDKILLAAPTGRAAKRMHEITKRKASTIHSLLEFDFRKGGFKKNRESPLECDLIIVDEASMIDTFLMFCLLKSIPNHSRVIFVGDINQLPSVGPGNVLKDIIDSHSLAVTQLNDIFRQAAGSKIITNAHLINNGVFPDMQNKEGSDFFFVEAAETELAIQQILTLIQQRIPRKYRFDPIDEIQVLSPMKKGALGTENLNTILQESLNPSKTALFRMGKKLAEKDKVMQIRNNYDKKVYNGDVGRIEKIDHIEQIVIVLFDDRRVEYDFSDLDEIVLAYAVSVHKYQGSECPCIVVPIHTCHFKLLHRNLLYTAVTRGKKLVILIGSKKAVAIAVKNDEVKRRFTGLYHALTATLTQLPYNL